MTPREKKLEDQCKVLADRLALLMAVCADCEIDFDLERESGDERNGWRELRRVILGNDEASIAERSRRRKLVFYEMSLRRIRQWMQKSLRGIAKEKQAA